MCKFLQLSLRSDQGHAWKDSIDKCNGLKLDSLIFLVIKLDLLANFPSLDQQCNFFYRNKYAIVMFMCAAVHLTTTLSRPHNEISYQIGLYIIVKDSVKYAQFSIGVQSTFQQGLIDRGRSQ